MTCPFCQHDIPDDSLFCPDCGRKVPTPEEEMEHPGDSHEESFEDSVKFIKLLSANHKDGRTHAGCGGNLFIGEDGSVRCDKCNVSDSLSKWRIDSQNLNSLVLTSSVNLVYSAAILAPMAMTEGISWMSRMLTVIRNK